MKKKSPPDVLPEVLGLLKRKMPYGAEITDDDFNLAYEMVWVMMAMETAEWMHQNVFIRRG